MKITLKEAADIIEALKEGKRIQGITERGYGVGVIYIDGNYIQWQHYGSSAEQITPHSIMFILEKIFSDCVTWDFCKYSQYHINYIPVNPQYKGLDCSTMHPNVYGL